MRIRSLSTFALLAAFITAMSAYAAFGQQKDEHPLITAEEMLAKYNKGEKMFIIDLRNPGAYASTSKKIVGDVRAGNDEELFEKIKDVPFDYQIITYCT